MKQFLNEQVGTTSERRKVTRRSGIGRRIHADRRATVQSFPPTGSATGRTPRQEQRRRNRRRTLPERRAARGAYSNAKEVSGDSATEVN